MSHGSIAQKNDFYQSCQIFIDFIYLFFIYLFEYSKHDVSNVKIYEIGGLQRWPFTTADSNPFYSNTTLELITENKTTRTGLV